MGTTGGRDGNVSLHGNMSYEKQGFQSGLASEVAGGCGFSNLGDAGKKNHWEAFRSQVLPQVTAIPKGESGGGREGYGSLTKKAEGVSLNGSEKGFEVDYTGPHLRDINLGLQKLNEMVIDIFSLKAGFFNPNGSPPKPNTHDGIGSERNSAGGGNQIETDCLEAKNRIGMVWDKLKMIQKIILGNNGQSERVLWNPSTKPEQYMLWGLKYDLGLMKKTMNQDDGDIR
jgi:hypothetical protein